MENRLEGKTIIGLGDSLMYGYKLDRDKPWIAILGEKHHMDWHNYGVNGSTCATPPEDDPKVMWRRLRDEVTKEKHPHVDYFIIQGGANDRNKNVPVGRITDCWNDHDDTVKGEIHTFCGSLNYMINTVKTRWPGARILMMTNYRRRDAVSEIGTVDQDYVDAMIAVARNRNVPVMDNYYSLGIDLREPAAAGTVTDHAWAVNTECHLSEEAYRWLAPIYEQRLLEI